MRQYELFLPITSIPASATDSSANEYAAAPHTVTAQVRAVPPAKLRLPAGAVLSARRDSAWREDSHDRGLPGPIRLQ